MHIKIWTSVDRPRGKQYHFHRDMCIVVVCLQISE